MILVATKPLDNRIIHHASTEKVQLDSLLDSNTDKCSTGEVASVMNYLICTAVIHIYIRYAGYMCMLY